MHKRISKIKKETIITERIILIYTLLVSIVFSGLSFRDNLITISNSTNIQLENIKLFLSNLHNGLFLIGSYNLIPNLLGSILSWNNFLFLSGLAITIPTIIIFSILNVYIYKLVTYTTKNNTAGLIGSLIITLNPNILYFVSSGSIFILYATLSVMLFYYLFKWLRENRNKYLFIISIITLLLILTNILSLIYILTISIYIYIREVKKYKNTKRFEATLITFLFLAIIPIIYIGIYNMYIYGSILGLISNPYTLSLNGILTNINTLGINTINIYGIFFIILSIVSYTLSFYIIDKKNIQILYNTLIIALIPILFTLLSVFFKIDSMQEVLLFIPFISITPSILLGIFLEKKSGRNKLRTNIKKYIKYLTFAIVIILSLIEFQFGQYYYNNYSKIYSYNYSKDFSQTLNYFNNHYKSGFVLADINNNSEFLKETNINPKFLITQINVEKYNNAIKIPWIYSDYIIIKKNSENKILKNSLKNKLYFKVLVNNKNYQILETNKLNTKIFALENNINISQIPSVYNTAKGEIYYSEKNTSIKYTLSSLWKYYKDNYITSIGEVQTKDQITSSRLQSYALLDSLYMNNKNSFNKIVDWTYSNMTKNGNPSAENYNLFVSLWGKQSNGSYGVINRKSSLDADTNIAYALVLASYKWNNARYIKMADAILNSIWRNEVVNINNINYLTAGNWAKNKSYDTLSPSYLSPYQYRLFAYIDPSHNWMGLVNSSYTIINSCSNLSGDTAHIPLDWCIIKSNGDFEKSSISDNFSFNSYMTLWKASLDYSLNRSLQAYKYIKNTNFFYNQWKDNGKIYSEYSMSGIALQKSQSVILYSVLIPYFNIYNKNMEKSIYNRLIISQARFYSGNNVYLTGNIYNNNFVLSMLYYYSGKIQSTQSLSDFIIKQNIKKSNNLNIGIFKIK